VLNRDNVNISQTTKLVEISKWNLV